MSSVVHFRLEFEVQDEKQYQKIVTRLVKEFPTLEFDVKIEHGDGLRKTKYTVCTGDYPWGANLKRIANILHKYDLK